MAAAEATTAPRSSSSVSDGDDRRSVDPEPTAEAESAPKSSGSSSSAGPSRSKGRGRGAAKLRRVQRMFAIEDRDPVGEDGEEVDDQPAGAIVPELGPSFEESAETPPTPEEQP